MSKDIKEKLINKMNPRTYKIKIKGMKQMKAKSIVMKFESSSDLQKLKGHPKLESLQIEEAKKRNSLLILYDVR